MQPESGQRSQWDYSSVRSGLADADDGWQDVVVLYQDPAKPRRRPSLIGALLSIPAKATNHQLENQATAVLAWLVDRSPVIAEGVLRLFLEDDAPAAGVIGARTWISLPQPGGE